MKKFTRCGNLISKKIGHAIGDYHMISHGDRILVAVSGGKDSLTLLDLLHARQSWAPVKYDLHIAHIIPDTTHTTVSSHDTLCSYLSSCGLPLHIQHIAIADEEGKTKCFWCSWNRRKALFDIAQAHGCNKLALGHTKDDIIETLLINLFFLGEYATMNPCQELFNGRLHVIRPLCYVLETATRQYAEERGLNLMKGECPYGEQAQRAYVKKLIADIERRSPYVKENLFRSMVRINHDYCQIKAPSCDS